MVVLADFFIPVISQKSGPFLLTSSIERTFSRELPEIAISIARVAGVASPVSLSSTRPILKMSPISSICVADRKEKPS
ncbi:MAG: hypothetical protein G01um101420_439 [Parcubacteria group bacterium Gr01-1014_20]|nr:MAG: hypothetical protein G01um101420_439 [Parcubacteria group bacterium Gr01-1014_20]